MVRVLLSAFVVASAFLAGAVTDSAQHKLEAIEQDRVPRGTVVVLGADELNLYVRGKVARSFRQGVRGAKLDLSAGRATGFAYIDFPKLGQAMGRPLGRLMTWLLAGERPVRVEAHIRSGGGRAQVDLDRVEVSGFSISGSALDYLIRNFVRPYYPDAIVGRPFALAHHVERLDVRPTEVRIVMAR